MQKLSIITINFNNLEGLKRTIESVVNQTWQEFEYIVIDGGSIDGSVAYIESQIDKIDYWVSEPDKGIYNAMNKGIKAAKGEYLLFLNSGDHLFDFEVLKNNICSICNYELIYFDLKVVNESGFFINEYPIKLRFSDLVAGSLPHPATFIKRNLFERIGLYDENLKIVADWKFFIIALFKFDSSYKKINVTFSTFYLDGISSNFDNKKILNSERKQVLVEYFSSFLLDYDELNRVRVHTEMNRYKMLIEIEKTVIGRKVISFFLRFYIVCFCRKRLKDVLEVKGKL